MPIYEYRCKSCHHQFEVIQKLNEAPASQCPKCQENTVERLISAPGFQLKGTGWYATDFKNIGKIDNTDKKPASTDNSTATEAKPAVSEPKADKDKSET